MRNQGMSILFLALEACSKGHWPMPDLLNLTTYVAPEMAYLWVAPAGSPEVPSTFESPWFLSDGIEGPPPVFSDILIIISHCHKP